MFCDNNFSDRKQRSLCFELIFNSSRGTFVNSHFLINFESYVCDD